MIIITRADGKSYPIDAAIKEEHKLDSKITRYPVEEGSNITDNIKPEPREISIEAVASDAPSDAIVTERKNRGFALDATGDASVHEQTYKFLEAIFNARERVTITSSLRTYENMLMDKLSIPRDSSNADSLEFSATFTEAIIVSNGRVKIRTATPSGQGRDNRNKLAATKNPIVMKNVVSFLTSSRSKIAALKIYGAKPLLSDSTPPLGKVGGAWDHWDVSFQPTQADGYIGSDKLYHPYGRNNQISDPNKDTKPVTDVLRTANRPVHYDDPTNSWRDNQDQEVTRATPRQDPKFWESLDRATPGGI